MKIHFNLLRWVIPATLSLSFSHIIIAQEPTVEAVKANASFEDTVVKTRALEVERIKKEGASIVEQGPWYSSANLRNRPYNTTSDHETKPFDKNDKQMWTVRPDYQDNKQYGLPDGANITTYLAREITATKPQTVTVALGSDDGFALFLNGKRIAGVDRGRGVKARDDIAKLDLKEGVNTLVFKIVNTGGASGFIYELEAKLPTDKVWKDIESQFSDDVALIGQTDQTFGPRFLMVDDPVALAKDFVKSALDPKTAEGFVNKIEQNKGNLSTVLSLVKTCAQLKHQMRAVKTQLPLITAKGLMAAVEDLEETQPGALKNVDQIKARIKKLEADLPSVMERIQKGDFSAVPAAGEMANLQREIMFANPALLALDDVVVVRRASNNLGLPCNWQGNTSIGKHGYNNELGKYSLKTGKYKAFYRPDDSSYVGDLEMHFDGEKMLFTGIVDGRWQVMEVGVDGKNLKQITKNAELKDVDNYEAMYLPDEKIIYTSSATYVGVPCVNGSDYVGNIHRMNPDGTDIRRLCFDQDNNWCPVLLEDGRILYLRWEYTDSAHYFSRILMNMNPDGTGQKEFYGSNSYWPNSLFYARPLPGSTNKFIGVVSGHHGVRRKGELYIFDVAKGRTETEGVVQQVKAHYSPSSKGKILDQLVNNATPFFLHPHPITDKLFIVAAKPRGGEWGLYLIDTFDNMTLLTQEEGMVFFEPTPVEKRVRPPVIPDKVNMKNSEATVMIQDIYEGPGLRGVPRGSVKSIRVFQYEYSYRDMGGHYAIGMEAGWDVRRLIGTVPVFEDGSCIFKIPANVPLAIQPLDADGKALQQFRSWFVAMPGEYLQCIGCHESQNQTALPRKTIAAGIDKEKAPRPTPFYGPKRGFAFDREVQPILNRYCTSCHDGKNKNIPDFSNREIDIAGSDIPWQMTGFSFAYNELHPYIRRGGGEGDYHILTPGEFHANTSPLIQLLNKGHHGVKMDKESMDKLISWIDLNVPFYGTWAEVAEVNRKVRPGSLGHFEDMARKRKKAREDFASVYEDIEEKTRGDKYDETPVMPEAVQAVKAVELTAKNWPLTEEQAKILQKDATTQGAETKVVDLGEGQKLTFIRIPAGEFNMGSISGFRDEQPVHTVKIEKPFWMATTEVSLAQYKTFDPQHKNGFYDQHYKDQVRPGYDMDKDPNYPVIRVSWKDAMDFCNWLAKKTGKKVTLPTEAQWEWAARAGSDKPFFYGDLNTDFSKFANLADVQLKKLAVQGVDPQPMHNPNKYFDYELKDPRFNDGYLHIAPVDKYEPNAFGLKNMNGNVNEWTLNTYRPYPFKTDANDVKTDDLTAIKVMRGGSWFDRPKRATSTTRFEYPAWQKVFNAGFRPIIEE